MSKKIEDSELTKRRADHKAQEQADAAMGMTIADRLSNRAKAQTTELTLSDGIGDFIITMRQPTRGEMDELQKLQGLIQKEVSQDDANKELCNMLGNLCIDDSLDYDFWMVGNYSMNDLIVIIQKLFESLVEQVKAVQSFRKE